MALSYALVDGPVFSGEASAILGEAWLPPALKYTPEYLRWQLSFPSGIPTPVAAAYDGSRPVGFAAATARRFETCGCGLDAAVVSFVAVRPAWRGRGVAAGLYSVLLKALHESDVPVVTFAITGSSGERAIARAYPEAGFAIQPLGNYPTYAFQRASPVNQEWRPGRGGFSELFSIVKFCSRDAVGLWSAPSKAQFEHYLADPRPRRFLVAENASTGALAAAWAIRSEVITPQGATVLTTLDSIWLPDARIEGFECLLRMAAAAWPDGGFSHYGDVPECWPLRRSVVAPARASEDRRTVCRLLLCPARADAAVMGMDQSGNCVTGLLAPAIRSYYGPEAAATRLRSSSTYSLGAGCLAVHCGDVTSASSVGNPSSALLFRRFAIFQNRCETISVMEDIPDAISNPRGEEPATVVTTPCRHEIGPPKPDPQRKPRLLVCS